MLDWPTIMKILRGLLAGAAIPDSSLSHPENASRDALMASKPKVSVSVSSFLDRSNREIASKKMIETIQCKAFIVLLLIPIGMEGYK